MAERSFKCPNCNNVIYKSFGMPHNIGCPIRICPHCKKEYNHPYTYEWSIISPLHKFAYCFFGDGRAFFFFLTIILSFLETWTISIISFVCWIAICIFWIKISDTQNIKESYQRTKDNPKYIQKLSDLGCTSIDIRIDPYYK